MLGNTDETSEALRHYRSLCADITAKKGGAHVDTLRVKASYALTLEEADEYVDCRRFRTRIATCYPYHQAEAP